LRGGLCLVRSGRRMRNSLCGQLSFESKHMNLIISKLEKHVDALKVFTSIALRTKWIYIFALRLAVSNSLLYSVREVWFVSTCHLRQGNSCVRAPLRLLLTSIRIAFGFVHRRGTPHFERVELCIACARTTLAVSAAAPS